MAYKKKMISRSYPHLYNISYAVGLEQGASGQAAAIKAASTNKSDDVMLVQYLLKRVYQKGSMVQPPLINLKIGNDMKIDGIWGPNTQGAINKFQLELYNAGRNIATDGVIDPDETPDGLSTVSLTGYTISYLNKYFSNQYPEYYANIALDPICPPKLKIALM